MSITINTSDFIKAKTVTIDGVELEFRPLTTAQSLAIVGAQKELRDNPKDIDKAETVINTFISAFSPVDQAKEILGELPLEAIASIVDKVSQDNA